MSKDKIFKYLTVRDNLEENKDYYLFVLNPNNKYTGFIRVVKPFKATYLNNSTWLKGPNYKENWDLSNNIKFQNDKTYYASMANCSIYTTLDDAVSEFNKTLNWFKKDMIRSRDYKVNLSWLKDRLNTYKEIC